MDRQSQIIRFGNDGWQSRLDEEFSLDNVVRVADALGLLWADEKPGSTVYVGFDTREDSARIAREAALVLGSYGLRAKVSDRPCPTPAVGWSCAADADAIGGLIITASDRSCEYGGLLVRAADGGPVNPEFIDALEREISGDPTTQRGNFEIVDLMSPYLEELVSEIDVEAIAAAGLSVVVDPMYGAGSDHLARLLEKCGCVVRQIHGEPKPDFNGLHPIAADPWADECEQEVVRTGVDLGLLLDGDADRASIVDEKGHLLPVSELAPMLMSYLVRDRGLSGRIIATTTRSACIERQASELGIDCVEVPVGFTRIYREVLEGDVLLGVEEYGGFCLPAHLNERDGLLVCMLVVELLAKKGVSLSQIVDEQRGRLGRTCYRRKDVHLDAAYTQAFRNILPGLNPPSVAGHVPVEVSHADGLRLEFEDGSWVLMRPSRTDAVVRVYAEAFNEKDRDELLDAVSELVKNGLSN